MCLWSEAADKVCLQLASGGHSPMHCATEQSKQYVCTITLTHQLMWTAAGHKVVFAQDSATLSGAAKYDLYLLQKGCVVESLGCSSATCL